MKAGTTGRHRQTIPDRPLIQAKVTTEVVGGAITTILPTLRPPLGRATASPTGRVRGQGRDPEDGRH